MYKLQNVIFLAFVLVAFIAVFKYIFEVHISFESLSPFYVDAIDYIANLNIFFFYFHVTIFQQIASIIFHFVDDLNP